MSLKRFSYGFLLGFISLFLVSCSGGETEQKPFKLDSITLDPASETITAGETISLTATGHFSDGTTSDVKDEITWSSTNTTVATVNDGVVTALSEGRVTIVAKTQAASALTDVTLSAKSTIIVNHSPLVSITVTPVDPSIADGTTQQFTATGRYEDTSTEDITDQVTWTSSNTGVATISNVAGGEGMATAVSSGTTTIAATLGSFSDTSILVVTPAELVSIAVTPANSSIAANTTSQFIATGTFTDASTQDITDQVTWESSDETKATISNVAGLEGLATSLASGTTTISASTDTVSGSTTLTVTSATLVSIAITPANPSVPNGLTKQFTATGTYSDASTQNITTSVTWTSSDALVATISNTIGSEGLATTVDEGSSTITATQGMISGNTTLTVSAPILAAIAVTPINSNIKNGTTAQFTAMGTFSDDSTQDLTTSVTWSSSDVTKATISNTGGSEGLASAVSAGDTTITATSGLISGSTTLTVDPATLISIDVTPANQSIADGTSQQFVATGLFDDASTQDLTTQVTWSSSDTMFVTVSNVSEEEGSATGVDPGASTITATLGLISGNTTLTVTAATLVSLAVDPVNPSIFNGTTEQFTVVGTFSDTTTQDLTADVVWDSSDHNVATIGNAIGSHGLATSTGEGSATITATFGIISDSTTLTVDPAELVSIEVTPDDAVIDVAGTQQYTATGTFSDGSTQDLTTSVTWSSSNNAKATISNTGGSEGVATGVAVGSTTIAATSGLISGNTTLTVQKLLDHVTITPTTATLKKNKNRQLTGTAYYSDGSTANVTNSLTRWTSSNPTTIKVNHNSNPGKIRALTNSGSSTITFTYTENGITENATLVVTATP